MPPGYLLNFSCPRPWRCEPASVMMASEPAKSLYECASFSHGASLPTSTIPLGCKSPKLASPRFLRKVKAHVYCNPAHHLSSERQSPLMRKLDFSMGTLKHSNISLDALRKA